MCVRLHTFPFSLLVLFSVLRITLRCQRVLDTRSSTSPHLALTVSSLRALRKLLASLYLFRASHKEERSCTDVEESRPLQYAVHVPNRKRIKDTSGKHILWLVKTMASNSGSNTASQSSLNHLYL